MAQVEINHDLTLMSTEERASKALSDLGRMQNAFRGAIVLDIEGNTKDVRADPESLTVGLSYAFRDDDDRRGLVAGYLPFKHSANNLPQEYLHILQANLHGLGNNGKSPHIIAHNAKYDLIGLRNNLGIDLLDTEWYDTMLLAHFNNENQFKDLSSVSVRLGGEPKAKNEAHDLIAKAFGWEHIPVEMMDPYSTHDAVITYKAFEKLLPDFNRQFPQELWDVERQWLRFITRVEQSGISLNHELVEAEAVFGERRMDALTTELGGNPGSSKHLEVLLFDRLSLPVLKRSDKTGKPSFDKTVMVQYEEMLEERKDPTANRILEYRGWQKTVSSNYRAYQNLLSPDGFLRPNYKLHGTVSGRVSCEKPNLQQIPRVSTKRWNGNLKKAFVPRPGYTLWEFDYSNLELRLAALYAQERYLIDAFQSGFKPFEAQAALLGWQGDVGRQSAKTLTYTILFGGGVRRISTAFGLPSHEAARIKETWWGIHPGLRAFTEKASQRARNRGYVKLWTERRRHFLDPKADSHKAGNAVIQGGGAELVKRSGIRLDSEIDWDTAKILLQIHDSYVAEIKNGTEDYWIPLIKGTMEDVQTLNPEFAQIPFPVGVKLWGEE